jgi:hypothetical protein
MVNSMSKGPGVRTGTCMGIKGEFVVPGAYDKSQRAEDSSCGLWINPTVWI